MSDVTGEDPKAALSYRLARAAVIILGVLLVIALVLLVVGVGLRLSGRGASAPPAPATAGFTLAPGARIVSMDSQPGRLILRIRSPAGDEIDIVDTQSGRLVSQIKAASENPK